MIRIAHDKEMNAVFDVRWKAQFEPLDIPKKDITKYDPDKESVTLIYTKNKNIIGTITAFLISNSVAEVYHLAVLNEFQMKGIGRKLVSAMEKELRKKGIKKMIIIGRTYLKKFYTSLGYDAVGIVRKYSEFEEKGILHQQMEKLL